MHILMTRPYLEGGGATQSLLNLAKGLVEKGHKVSLACAGGLWFSKARQAGLPTFQIPLAPSTPLHLFFAARKLRNILNHQQIDLVHNHHRFSGLAVRMAIAGLSIPYVTTVHEYKTNLSWLTRLGLGDHILTFSNALKRHLIHQYQINAEKISVIPMGFEQEQFRKSSISNHASKSPSIGCIARLSTEKGVSILLQAAAHLHQNTPHRPHFFIAGDGPLFGQLVALAETLNIKNYVTFMGWQENVNNLIVQCNYLVMPSLQEGFGLVVLEGWALERPTIGSDVGGISELIVNGETGLLVPPNDPLALTNAMIQLLENQKLVSEMGKRGRLEMLPKFTIEAMVEQTDLIYGRLINQ